MVSSVNTQQHQWGSRFKFHGNQGSHWTLSGYCISVQQSNDINFGETLIHQLLYVGYCIAPIRKFTLVRIVKLGECVEKMFWGFVGLSYIIHPLHVLDSCIDFVFCVFISSSVLFCYAQVSEGGPGHYVFASAELGPREDSWSGGCSLHFSVWHQQMEGQKVSEPERAPRGCFISIYVASCLILFIILCRYTELCIILTFGLNKLKKVSWIIITIIIIYYFAITQYFSSLESKPCPLFRYNCGTLQTMEAK